MRWVAVEEDGLLVYPRRDELRVGRMCFFKGIFFTCFLRLNLRQYLAKVDGQSQSADQAYDAWCYTTMIHAHVSRFNFRVN